MISPPRILMLCAASIAGALIFISTAGETQINDTTIEAEVDVGYARASEDVRVVAVAIRACTPLDPERLARIGPEALSQPYVGTDSTRYVLLNDAVLRHNLPATEALVAAGADVRYTDHLMVFNALRIQQEREIVPFPDYTVGLPFLRLYLDNGGQTDIQFMRDNTGRTALNYAFDNLAGALVLLEHGADPWLQATSPQGNPMRSYFDSQVSGTMNSVAAEFFFRMIHAGHLTGATPDQLDLIMNMLERYLDQALTSGRERDIYAA